MYMYTLEPLYNRHLWDSNYCPLYGGVLYSGVPHLACSTILKLILLIIIMNYNTIFICVMISVLVIKLYGGHELIN